MSVRPFRAALCAAVAVATACSGPELDTDGAVARHHAGVRDRLLEQQAERALEVGDATAAARHLAQLAEDLAENPRGRLVLARTLIAEGRLGKCDTLLAELATARPDDHEVDLVAGTLEEARGRWEAARVAYERALDKAPGHIQATLLRARMDVVLGEPGRAAAHLERALARTPGQVELQEALALAYLAADEPVFAAEAYKAAIERDPHDRTLRVHQAFSLSLAGRHLDAVRAVDLVADGDIPSYARLALGRSALMIDDPRKASNWLELYLQEHPDDGPAWLDLARARYLMGLGHPTLEALRQALRVDPGNADAVVLLGHLRLRSGQRELALDAYLEAVRLGAPAAQLAPVLEDLIKTGDEAAPVAAATESAGA